MTPVRIIRDQFAAIGYADDAILVDYAFADVLSSAADTQTVALAAFTQTPPSYRTAAFGVVQCESGPSDLTPYRALGAPAIFVISGENVELWQVKADGPQRRLATARVDDLATLFAQNAEHWNPKAVHRAKAITPQAPGGQLDFIDIGLMVAIEGEVHVKLDQLLRQTLSGVLDARGRPNIDARVLFQATFRFLAAKILADRGHGAALVWDGDDVRSVLEGIEAYYGLGGPSLAASSRALAILDEVWRGIRGGINFRNISADDLAFVYENTFVTSEVRAELGTHSTPRQMAEHVVRRLELWRESERCKVYEPFTGAGILLVSALRQLRDALPLDWSDVQRHAFLTERLTGDEIDEFACEVAKLSLILADYPNHNGWDIGQADLFDGSRLTDRIDSDTFVLCNPPFEVFALADRQTDLAQRDLSKPVAVLQAVLDAKPAGLGFVLPAAFAVERQYLKIRQRLEEDFGTVEIVEVPDGVFNASSTAAALLIARDRRPADAERRIVLRSSEVTQRDRIPFLRAGVITRSREQVRWVPEAPSGDLWIPALQELWTYLQDHPRLDASLKMHRGVEWILDQSQTWRDTPAEGFRRGLHSARGRLQYADQPAVWLDCRPENSRFGGLGFDWSATKILLNAARISRGPWRLAASLDEAGLVASQQFIGAWPRQPMSRAGLLSITALLNGPVANAFAAIFTSGKGLRLGTLGRLPLPQAWAPELPELVEGYLAELNRNEVLLRPGRLESMLVEIDAAGLRSYDLPRRLERDLLAWFEGARRPVPHPFPGWGDLTAAQGLSLSEMLEGRGARHAGNWVGQLFRPLPVEEAEDLQAWAG